MITRSSFKDAAWLRFTTGVRCHAALFLLAAPASAWVHFELVTVGHQSVENVSYAYRIGKFEVTNEQYAAFLNAVAGQSDPGGLFAAEMQSDPRGGIARSGQAGAFTYASKANFADKPVNFVSWVDAARFCNWLHNWQPAGPQSPATTEDGAYTITAEAIASGDLARNPQARFALPTLNEWRKAGHWNSVELTWSYATQSDSPPVAALATTTGGVSNSGASVANYDSAADWGGQDGNVTSVGACGSPSFYGTYDQSGNVAEWMEFSSSTSPPTQRGIKGGAWDSGSVSLSATVFQSLSMVHQSSRVGFRIARVFPPIDPPLVEIGSPNNAADSITGKGAVASRFRIGRTEVTNEEYCALLNAWDVGPQLDGFWSSSMQSAVQGGIARTGSSAAGYLYWAKPGFARKPVNFVSYRDATRFCNWLHHGQPVAGATSLTSLNDGAYDTVAVNIAHPRNAGARYFLPTRDEWFKAARFDPVNPDADANGNGNYWQTPLLSDSAPQAATCNAAGEIDDSKGTPVANHGGVCNWNGSGGGNVTTVGGAGAVSLSPWSCADMLGNVTEFTEGFGGNSTIVMGRHYKSTAQELLDDTDQYVAIAGRSDIYGFRIAALPLPAPINFVPVPKGGDVDHDLEIGAFETTNAEYAAFLNAVGAVTNDPHSLHDPLMASDVRGGIQKVTLFGVTSFFAKPGMADKPVNHVSYYDACRYCNWLHHGQPRGPEVMALLESGAYAMDPSREANSQEVSLVGSARFRLPFEREWIKAARYQPESDTYADYAFGSNLDPLPAQLNDEGDVLNPGSRCVNFDSFINGRLSSVGQCGNRSYFGAADMNGNVAELAVTPAADPPASFLRHYGGAFSSTKLQLSVMSVVPPATAATSTGFRVVKVSRGQPLPPLASPGRPVEILAFSHLGDHARLVFTTRPGRHYSVIGSNNLSAWSQDLFFLNLPGTGEPRVVILGTSVILPRRFYRVVED